jgi:hypothetical protein
MRKAKDWDLVLSYVDEDGDRQYDVIDPDIDKQIKQFMKNQRYVKHTKAWKKGWLELSKPERKKESGYTYDQLRAGLRLLHIVLSHIGSVERPQKTTT